MNRQQLAHILRAACEVTGDPDVVVVGSQSILGTYDEDDLPPAVMMSMEADLAWQRDSGDRERAETVNGAIGELSGFHETNGYFPEGVSLGTVILPEVGRIACMAGAWPPPPRPRHSSSTSMTSLSRSWPPSGIRTVRLPQR